MKKNRIFLFLSLFVFMLAPLASAGDVWENAKSDQYGTKAGGMLGRGLINIGSCFLDLAVHTVEGTKNGPPLVGTLTGLGSGAGCTVLRAGSGVLDVASFWVPDFNGIPISRSYSNCLETDSTTAYHSVSSADSSGSYVASAPSSSALSPSGSSKSKASDPMEYVKK